VPKFLAEMVDRLHSDASDTLKQIAGGGWSDETQDALRASIEQFAEDFGYDLDEEGQPLDEGGDDDRRNGGGPEGRTRDSEQGEDEARPDDNDEREAGAVAAGQS
jgi:F-type H+/Na+-transporting ATPase subunit alpha